MSYGLPVAKDQPEFEIEFVNSGPTSTVGTFFLHARCFAAGSLSERSRRRDGRPRPEADGYWRLVPVVEAVAQ